MKIILDTHIFLWALSEPKKIDSIQLQEIETQANKIFISSISIAEIMIKTSLKKIDINFDPLEMAEKSGFEFLNFGAKDAILLKDLPFYHKDPFDRMIIAQSIANKYHIISNDHKFQLYDCKLI
ncbi:MAG TPA: type II toxin-antitoxin system VapC family toxin [Spirochaetes bacterium]|nr:type II toxin-antitoxin system VapC family toxin [Spirochaetota bacterium]